jgi:hypothetical protein
MPEFAMGASGVSGEICAIDGAPVKASERTAGANKNFMLAS